MYGTQMRQSLFGRGLGRFYGALPMRAKLLTRVTRLEGGQFTSLTLRQVLSQHFGVEVGPYSYGSLLEPGMADRGTQIGAYVSVGPNVRRFGAAHPMDEPSMHPYWYNPRLGFVSADEDVPRTRCEIGHDAWIGANAVILPGCARIGIGAVIGAGAIVTQDIPDFAIAVGNPARVIRERLTPELRKALIEARPWLQEPAEARRIFQEIGRSGR